MASFPKVATDFDQIIQADRQRKKNEQLAKEIFGRNKQRDNKKRDDKRTGRPTAPSLASRVGIAKRSSSTSSNNPSPKFQSKPRSSLPTQNVRATRIADELDNRTTAIIVPTQPRAVAASSNASGGLSIKGASGPFVLHASNFAPGTTAADIESALHPDTIYNNGISSLVSCKIVGTRPDVVAELVFTEKVVAESIIAKYDGQKADGRILRVDLVRSGVGAMSKNHQHQQPPPQTPSQPAQQPQQPQAQSQRQDRRDRQQNSTPQIQEEIVMGMEPEIESTENNAMEDVEMGIEAPPPIFKDEREAADRDRRDRHSHRERGDNSTIDSNEIKRREGGDERRRDDRTRDRDSNRERDRSRDRERDRQRDWERGGFERRGGGGGGGGSGSDERVQRDDGGRNNRTSHYGNGVSMGPRGGFGGFAGAGGGGGGPGGYRGGRYGEGYGGGNGGGGRGGYRGGYRGYR